MRGRTGNAFHKTSTQAHHQMRGMPGGLKSLVNEAASFRRCLQGSRLTFQLSSPVASERFDFTSQNKFSLARLFFA